MANYRSERTLEDVRAESDQYTNESLAATRRMKEMVHDTRDVGKQTLEMLDEQGEQLRRIEQGQNKINEDTRRAEAHVTQMERCCGLCLCRRNKSFEKNSWYAKVWKKSDTDDEGKVIDAQPEAVEGMSARGANTKKGGAQKDFVKRITNDAREDEMNDNLGVVHDILGELRQQAETMGTELDEQNKTIERITNKAELNTMRVDAVADRTQRLLKK